MTIGSLYPGCHSSFSILDAQNTPCGEITLDLLPWTHPAEFAGHPREIAGEATTAPSAIFEFLLLAERHNRMKNDRIALGKCHDALAKLAEKDTFWVMMVEYLDEKGAYERRGIGHVRKTSVERSFAPGPEWKEVVLA